MTKYNTHPPRKHQVFITCLCSLGLKHPQKGKPEGSLQVLSGVLHITPSSLTGHKLSSISPNLRSNSKAKSGMQPQLNKTCIPKVCCYFLKWCLSFPKYQYIQIHYFAYRKLWNVIYNCYECKPLQRSPLYSNRHHLRCFVKHMQKSSASPINPWTMVTDAKILSSLELQEEAVTKNYCRKQNDL